MRAADPVDAPIAHGGSLVEARRLFPGAPEPFIDLSTGINPHSYPLPALPHELFTRLPEPASLEGLREDAARAYDAPSAAHITCAPGTSILIPRLMALHPPGHVAVLGPTYAEHAHAARLAGHRVVETGNLALLAEADIAVVVNPNNPDGRLLARADLLALRDRLRARGGLLVVDEAFMDAMPGGVSLATEVQDGGLAVLRSFGKFHGLAGIRLGFAISEAATAARLAAALGPWPVSGPAIAIARTALPDAAWRSAMQAQLARASDRLDGLLQTAALEIVGGTCLFRLVSGGEQLFGHLGRAGILVRRFQERPGLFRFGLPATEEGWTRLAHCLQRL